MKRTVEDNGGPIQIILVADAYDLRSEAGRVPGSIIHQTILHGLTFPLKKEEPARIIRPGRNLHFF
jgi:hypothetical protein